MSDSFLNVYNTSGKFNDTIRDFALQIFRLKFGIQKSNAKRNLYKILLDVSNDSAKLRALKYLYKDWYPYFIRLMNSYIEAYHTRPNYYRDERKREAILYQRLKRIIDTSKNNSVCVEGGEYHASEYPDSSMLRSNFNLVKYLDQGDFTNHFSIEPYYKDFEPFYKNVPLKLKVRQNKDCEFEFQLVDKKMGLIFW